MSTKPNVLLVLTDDQRFDTIGALGCEAIKTPNLDRLVKMGTSFTHAHIPSGMVGAVCMPSRAMLHTGRSLFHLDGAGSEIPADHTTMGECFRAQGYETFGTGKWHNGREAYQRSFTHGEHIFFGGMCDHWNVPCYHYDPEGKYDSTLLACPTRGRNHTLKVRNADHIESGQHSSDILADCTADWIRERDGETPWFAYLSFLAPHDPRTMPQEYLDMYPVEDIELPPNFMGGHPWDTGALNIRDELLEEFPRTPDAVKEHIAEYYAMMTHLDDCLGRVLKVLEERGELEDTLIVFTGDNGLAVGQHGLMGKQSHYEHSIRVPLIVSGPGVSKAAETDLPVYLFDIFGTLCEHLGFETPGSVESQSFAPALKGGTAQAREVLFFAYADTLRSVKKGKYKYTRASVEERAPIHRLYDVEADPWELTDLSEDPAHAALLAELKQELRTQADAWSDPESEWGETFWGRVAVEDA